MAILFTFYRKKNINFINNSLWDLPSPVSMTYFWNFGSVLGLCLSVQILSGLFLSFHYSPLSAESFNSVVDIMREIWFGWFIRFFHMNGASMFFIFIYLHLFRGIYFFSPSHKKVWLSGVFVLLILMAISFFGYVLPWGQMSYWGVAVITNLFSVVPIIGNELVYWIWGSFSVSKPTLTRFYSFHFLLPFILLFMVLIHLVFLHKEGSSNNLGMNSNMDKIEFHPFFSVKDLFFIFFVLFMVFFFSLLTPHIFSDPVNMIPANNLQTPIHIQPEWYFLPSYAILRSVSSKTLGVIFLALSIGIYSLLPMFNFKFSPKFSFTHQFNFFLLILSFFILLKMGASPAEEPYIMVSKIFSILYFFSILSINLCFKYNYFENNLKK